MFNSFQQAILVTFGKTVTAMLAGLAFVYFKFPGKWIVFFFVLVTLMMPTEVMILAMFQLVAGFGWQDNDGRPGGALHRLCHRSIPVPTALRQHAGRAARGCSDRWRFAAPVPA